MSSGDLVVGEIEPGYRLVGRPSGELLIGDVDRSCNQLPPGVEFVSTNPEAFWADLARHGWHWGPELLDVVDFLVWCDNASIESLVSFAARDSESLVRKVLYYK